MEIPDDWNSGRKMLSEDQFIAASIGDIDWLHQSISKGKVKYDKNVRILAYIIWENCKIIHC